MNFSLTLLIYKETDAQKSVVLGIRYKLFLKREGIILFAFFQCYAQRMPKRFVSGK